MNETMGNRINKYRKLKNMTQEELAEKMGVSSQAVSKWEKDASCPDISLLPQLSKLLGITTDELLTGNTSEVQMLPPTERKSLEELTLRVYVNSADGDRVKINLPMALVKVGMELGMETSIMGNQNAMKNIDFEKILLLAQQGAVGKLVEVESSEGDIVEVVVE